MRAVREVGFTLVEVLVTLLLLGIVVQGGWTVFATFRKAGAAVGDSAERLETVRTVAWILSEEMSGGVRGRDWWLDSSDSISLRAFRGFVVVMGDEEDGRIEVCFRGDRTPNPSKDSILLLVESGSWVPHALASRERRREDCLPGSGGRKESWRLEPAYGGGRIGRLFESGSYHFSQRAFRYRRGRGGRQPLTPEQILNGEMVVGRSRGIQWEISLPNSKREGDSLNWAGTVR